ncbi:FtsX-like permease family protein [Microbacterium sp. 10M-3C3]|uniref:FtsX-like permease family protein n=1 Tax=Microbacterium sp. 10M-3C3 TaxID=2483401 RepID=UPI000F62EF9E|nr:FtsX-like permease family protein [Microbacterium sp. 10M-3C3]
MSLLSPWRARAAQSRRHLGVLTLYALLIAALTAAAVVLPRAVGAADEARFAGVLSDDHAAAAELALGVQYLGEPADLAAQMSAAVDDTAARARDPFRAAIRERGWIAQLEPLGVSGLTPPGDADGISLILGAATRIPVSGPVDGALPDTWDGAGTLPIAVSRTVADRLALGVGQVFEAGPVPVRVAAVFDVDADAPGVDHRATLDRVTSESLRDGTTLLTVGAWIPPAALAALGPQLTGVQVTGWLAIDPARVSVADRDALASALRASSSAGAYLRDGQPLQLSSRLPTLLERAGRAEATAHALVWLLSAGAIAALVAAVVATAFGAARAREGDRALLRARGATTGRMLRDGAVDLALVAVVGAACGAGAAVIAAPDGEAAPVAAAIALAVAGSALLGAAAVVPAPTRARPLAIAAGVLVVVVGVAGVLTLAARGYTEDDLDLFLAAVPATATGAAAVMVAAVLPAVLAVLARVVSRGAHTRAWLGARWAARRGAGVAPVLAVLLAVTSATSALLIGQTLDAGLESAARSAVGADIRLDAGGDVPPPGVLAGLDGVAAAVQVDTLVPATVTDGGRLRAVTVLVADTTALHAVRPDLPVLERGAALAPPDLADALGETGSARGVEIGGVGKVDIVRSSADLPVRDGRWLLLDRDTITSDALSLAARWTLVRAGDTAVAARTIAQRIGASPTAGSASLHTVAAARAERDGDPTVAVVRAVLVAGVILPSLLALVSVMAAVVSSSRERHSLWGVARLTGARAWGRGLLAVWQVGPVAVVAASVGVGLGVGLAAVIHGATDIAAATGGLPVDTRVPAAAWLAVPAIAIVLSATALVADAVSRPPRLALLVRNGAP